MFAITNTLSKILTTNMLFIPMAMIGFVDHDNSEYAAYNDDNDKHAVYNDNEGKLAV